MRILFLHPNFPGQFVRPAILLANAGHDTRFLCQTHYGRTIRKVQRYTLKGKLGLDALNSLAKAGKNKTIILADQYRRAMEAFKKDEWNPDLVISHTGFGCGLHSQYVWPNARKIAYVEWWFATNSKMRTYEINKQSTVNELSARERNLAIALELSEADEIVAPTHWQRQQLPNSLKSRCLVIHDGVDLKRFKPDGSKANSTPLLTYGTRGMEPMRGFPSFIQELPSIMDKYSDLEVEIAGTDEICYGGGGEVVPKEGSYGSWAQKVLSKWIKENRVRFLGRLNPKDYECWLQKSWMHVYLTKPFVASWSLLEAMSSGCCIIASDTEPVRDFLSAKEAIMVDFKIPGWLMDPVEQLISSKKTREAYGASARGQSLNWDERLTFEKWGLLSNPQARFHQT